MSPGMRSAARAVVIAAGATVVVASALAFRLEDWPIYVTFALLVAVLLPFHVEVLPNLVMPMPSLAVTLGFVYIGGLPILLVYNAAYNAVFLLLRFVHGALPEPWRSRVPYPLGGGSEIFALRSVLAPGVRAMALAEHATFALGLATRVLIVSLLAPGGRPASHPGAIAVAELGGYVCWGLLWFLPIRRFGAVPRDARDDWPRAAYYDLGLIMIFALTPFVFLIAHAYETYGLTGAAAWSLSALALHFMLQRLNSRRVMVEQQNRRLEALNRELEHRERLSAIGKMSSVVSHQMLQQLGLIGIQADLLRHANAGSDIAATVAQAKRSGKAIEEALSAVNRVLRDLLVFSRDLRVNLYDHPLARVLEECIEECGRQAMERGVTLRLECPAEAGVTLDKLKIKQAVANVVRNAIEASPPGSEVLLRAGVRDGWAEIAVTDRGPGVLDRDRDAIFAPFFSTKEEGTGLGLAIARAFVEAHGGQIVIESRATDGATFVLRLPQRGPMPSG